MAQNSLTYHQIWFRTIIQENLEPEIPNLWNQGSQMGRLEDQTG